MYKSFSNDTFVLEKKSVIILHQSDFIANIMQWFDQFFRDQGIERLL